ncbi:EF-hand domain-containing protein [Aliiroseovarius crassostreae]|uniref:EF-hand domain-containing protein n=1 Tax=Aliiroseovarius crassostreae TaxID=154981 RepID=UPI003C7C055C
MRAPIITTATIALVAALSAPALAQNQPGEHFMEMWDLNEDGQVTLDEATERRSDIFYMFDSDEDGVLTAEEYVNFDETRAIDMQEHGIGQGMGQGQGQGKRNGQGNGQGKGMGQGNGQGKGMGQGQGQGQGKMRGNGAAPGEHSAARSMERQNADLNGDGNVSREEFLEGVAPWFTRQDRDGDGVITSADFGRG